MTTVSALLIIMLVPSGAQAFITRSTHAFITRSALARLTPAAATIRMNAGTGEGFNSFRRWPSAASVTLTSSARSFFGLSEQSEVTLDQMRDCNKYNAGTLEKVMNAQPIADQRGEEVRLDCNYVEDECQLQWIKVV